MRRTRNAPWVSAMSPPDETAPSGAGADRGAAAGRTPGAPCRRTSRQSRDPAVLTRWDAVEIGGRVHLVGVLVGGHDRLPAGAWIVTSPVHSLDLVTRTAVTASTGRRYVLGTRLEGLFPEGARDVIAQALRTWRVDGAPPSAALSDAEIVRKLEPSHLPERSRDPIEPTADAATNDDPSGGKGRP
jgi:hypothetical protein